MAYDPTLVLDMRSMLPFMDGATQRIRDFSGNGNHGTPMNFTGDDSEYVDGRLGQSVYFPIVGVGVNRHINCGNDDSINTMLTISVEIIFTPLQSALQKDIVSKFNPAGNLTYLLLNLAGGVFQFYTGGGAAANAANSTTVVVDNIPFHIIGTHDGTNTNIFVNGRLEGSAATPLAPIPSTTDLLLGIRNNLTLDYFGYFHRFRIWNRGMGAAEIWNRYINRFRV